MCSPAKTDELISGKFELLDHHGRSVSEHSYDGSLRLVFFGFTQCPDVCPTTLFEVANVMRRLGPEASEVQPLFISVDRDNDTRERIASYVAAFHPAMVGLIGSERQLDAAARSFRVTYGVEHTVNGSAASGSVFHSSHLFLMDRQGGFLEVFGYGTKAETIESTIRQYL
jgi:protein SCO1/2